MDGAEFMHACQIEMPPWTSIFRHGRKWLILKNEFGDIAILSAVSMFANAFDHPSLESLVSNKYSHLGCLVELAYLLNGLE